MVMSMCVLEGVEDNFCKCKETAVDSATYTRIPFEPLLDPRDYLLEIILSDSTMVSFSFGNIYPPYARIPFDPCWIQEIISWRLQTQTPQGVHLTFQYIYPPYARIPSDPCWIQEIISWR